MVILKSPGVRGILKGHRNPRGTLRGTPIDPTGTHTVLGTLRTSKDPGNPKSPGDSQKVQGRSQKVLETTREPPKVQDT